MFIFSCAEYNHSRFREIIFIFYFSTLNVNVLVGIEPTDKHNVVSTVLSTTCKHKEQVALKLFTIYATYNLMGSTQVSNCICTYYLLSGD